MYDFKNIEGICKDILYRKNKRNPKMTSLKLSANTKMKIIFNQ